MTTKRSILAMIVLLGLVLLVGVLFSIGRKSPTVAHTASSSSGSDALASPHELDPPRNIAEYTTREDVPPAPLDANVLRDATSVSGTVLDAESGVPIDRFEVVHSPTGAGGTYVDTLFGFELAHPNPSLAFADAGGRFTLHDLGPDARNVTVVAPGYEIAKVQVVETDPGVAHDDLVFRMRRAAIVHGRVIDPASGASVEGALVAWIDDGGQTRTGPKERFERTDALGRFALDYVPAGPRRLLAGREDLGQAFSPFLEFESGAALQEIVIELGGWSPK